jgi:hypothetical protein
MCVTNNDLGHLCDDAPHLTPTTTCRR